MELSYSERGSKEGEGEHGGDWEEKGNRGKGREVDRQAGRQAHRQRVCIEPM